MAFKQDIDAALSSVLRRREYTVTILSDRAAVIEHGGKLLSIDGASVVIGAAKAKVAIEGKDLVVKESGGGQIFVIGAIDRVEVVR